MGSRWQNVLPSPVAFVLSGGASLGAIQVGMLQALAEVGLEPDLIVGSSVGALNGAAISEYGLARSVELLTDVWKGLKRQDLSGSFFAQIRELLKTRVSFFPQERLTSLIQRVLSVHKFEQLALPFGVFATELGTLRGALFTQGELLPALLATTALPGVYQPVRINGVHYIDGGMVANVPLKAALDMGAKSIVVLDAADSCLRSPPRHILDMIILTLHTVFRQRARAEAPLIADICPVLYIPRPCASRRSILNFNGTPPLIDLAAQTAKNFLAHCPIPEPGIMAGDPHFHREPAREAVKEQAHRAPLQNLALE